MNDPVKGCDVYRNIGCSHVDGFLCDYPDCSILKEYKMKHEDRALPLHTVYDPNGNPYISIIEDGDVIKMRLHNYDDISDRGIYLTIDKRAVPSLINALGKVSIKGIKF